MRNKGVSLVVAMWFVLGLCAVSWGAESPSLDRGRWAPATRAAIQALIDRNGSSSSSYDTSKPPYVVLDWDRTCAFHDCERRLFVYQIDTLAYKMTPDEFAKAIMMTVPEDGLFPEPYHNEAGEKVSVSDITADIVSDYRFLYKNYEGFGGAMSLEDIHKTPEFLDFRAKLHFFYRAMKPLKAERKIITPWTPFLFVNMTGAEVRSLAVECDIHALGESLGTRMLRSPESLPGKSGIVQWEHWLGLRIFPEMTNLMNVLRANGIKVYVCTASFADVVRAFAQYPEFGYDVPLEDVFGMELERNGDDVILMAYKKGHPVTSGPGKTEMIRQALVKRHGYGPIFVAGDSNGDANMMEDFPSTQLTLLINRLGGGLVGDHCTKAVEAMGTDLPRFVLQGRDENTGLFRPSEKTIPYGKTVLEERLLK